MLVKMTKIHVFFHNFVSEKFVVLNASKTSTPFRQCLSNVITQFFHLCVLELDLMMHHPCVFCYEMSPFLVADGSDLSMVLDKLFFGSSRIPCCIILHSVLGIFLCWNVSEGIVESVGSLLHGLFSFKKWSVATHGWWSGVLITDILFLETTPASPNNLSWQKFTSECYQRREPG
jgi:hypothetical protein